LNDEVKGSSDQNGSMTERPVFAYSTNARWKGSRKYQVAELLD
jgi:hypothetical protein